MGKNTSQKVTEIPEFKGIAGLIPKIAPATTSTPLSNPGKAVSKAQKAANKLKQKKKKNAVHKTPRTTDSSQTSRTSPSNTGDIPASLLKKSKKRKLKTKLAPAVTSQREESEPGVKKLKSDYTPGALSQFLGGERKPSALFDRVGKKPKAPSPATAQSPATVQPLTISKRKAEKEAMKEKKERKEEGPDATARTVFVGNLPLECTEKMLKAHFGEVGSIDSLRFRNAAVPEGSKLPKKAAVITKTLHANCQRLNAYVKFKELRSVAEALKLNGTVVGGRHIVVDSAVNTSGKYDPSRTVFVGNLSFEADEEEVRDHFGECGDIHGVRIVRDSATQLGKGFAFVSFKDVASVSLALRLHGQPLGKRNLRVTMASNQNKDKTFEMKLKKKKLPRGGVNTSRVAVNVDKKREGAPRGLKKKMKKKKHAQAVKASRKSLMT